ncbi:hypothetical protein IRL76_13930 [Qipengyuania soli]|uniref:Molecular chaperone n=1 Tax=Qipengyuania soli TaxID=2782568 RepID=A0A7S8F4C2_9SPHN|nr:hypothetical protein IRL76_13930 [Qipengyuania soli]
MTSGPTKKLRSRVAAGTAIACLMAMGITSSSAQQAGDLGAAVPVPPAGSVGGMGDVNLFPKRVVINGRREIATVGLYNKTLDDGEYEIAIVDMAMTPQGQLVRFDNGLDEATKAKVRTASEMLRYSPRRVILRGSESQLVRIMARAGAEVPDGEYRSHFVVTSVPEDAGFSIEQAAGAQQPDGIGVTIRPRFGIAIPVFVRVGTTTLDVDITAPRIITEPDGSRAVSFTLTRSGTRSAFGDVFVRAQGSSKPIAISKGIGVYPEVDSRQVIVPIDPTTDPRLLAKGTRLTIDFVDDDFSPGNKLAESAFQVP